MVGSSVISGLDPCDKVAYISGLLGRVSSCGNVQGRQSQQMFKDFASQFVRRLVQNQEILDISKIGKQVSMM